MKRLYLKPSQARMALQAWSKLCSTNKLEDGWLQELLEGSEETLKQLYVNERGHLSSSLATIAKKEKISKIRFQYLRSWLHKFRGLERRHFVLVSIEQLQNQRLALVGLRNVFDVLIRHISTSEIKDEIKGLLEHDYLVVGYAVDEVVDSEDSTRSKTKLDLRESGLLNSNTNLEPYPNLQSAVIQFQSECSPIVRDYEQWIAERNISEYLTAIRAGLVASVPIILFASFMDQVGLPWLQRNFIEIAPIKKALEIIIRFITGYTTTLMIWVNLEGGLQKALNSLFRLFNRGYSSQKPSNALIVYRAAAAGTLIGPCAVLTAKLINLQETVPIYAVVAMLAASSDNLVGALSQVNLAFLRSVHGSLTKKIISGLSHPFFLANICAVTFFTLFDSILRVTSGGEIFGFLSAMGIEGLTMGVGDTALVYVVLRTWEALKIRQLLGSLNK